NLQLIAINGFDEVMASLAERCNALPIAARSTDRRAAGSEDVPFDMRVTADATLDELDWTRVQIQVTDYCRKMQIEVPANITRQWLEERMEQLDLLRRSDSGLVPTNA